MKKMSSFLETLKIRESRIDKDSWFVLALGFLLGRTVFSGGLAPFAPAFYAGLRRNRPSLSIYAALVATAGAATFGDWGFVAYNLLAIILITLGMRVGQGRTLPPILDPILAGAIVAISSGVNKAANAPSMFWYLSALLEGLCAVVIAALTQTAFLPEKEKDRDNAPAALEKSSEALLVIGLLSLGGLHGLTIYGISVEAIIAMGCTLVAGFVAGPGGGATAGLAAGLVVALTGSESPGILAVMGTSGLLAGIGGWFGKTEAIIGYISGGLLMSMYADSVGGLSLRFAEQLIGIVAIFLITSKTQKRLAERFPLLATSRGVPRPRSVPEYGGIKTAAVAHALMEMGEMLSGVAAMAQPDSEHYAPVTQPSALRQVAERVCIDCQQRTLCWEDRFAETFELMSDLTMSMQVGTQITSDCNSPLSDRCVRFPQVILELNHRSELDRLERRIHAMDGETKECLSFQYRCLGQLLTSKSQSRADENTRSRRQTLKVTLKGASTPAEGSDRPGDMWVKYDISPARTLAVLVDGMGKGDEAAKQSKETIAILKSLLDCGLDYDSCVSFLNSALFLACRPDSFVAVDCLLIDQDTERAYFHKLGAPPSFIRKKDGNILVVRGSRPPAGVFNSLPCFATSEPVAAGDEIYLVSDGIFRSSPVPARAEQILVSKLRRLKDGSLDLAVKTLLTSGRRVGGEEPSDDVTVVVARIERV